jgi:nucleoside-diphosphate-sugar epimerase
MSVALPGRRIAVLGGTGFIGSHLVERLVAEGAEVLATGRNLANLDRLARVRADCSVALCDLRDAEDVTRTFAMFRPEIVYHLAAHPDGPETFDQFASCIAVNGSGLVNALRASAACGAELFVYGDSTKVYGNGQVPFRASQEAAPLCSYAVVKAAGWQLCQLAAGCSSLQVASLRPTFVYGPRQSRNIVTHVRDCVAAGRPVRLQGGRQTRDPLYVEDAVAAFAAVPLHRRAWGHAIPIGGGHEMSVTSLCDTVLSALGARNPILEDGEPPRSTEVWRSSSDNADAYRLLDWTPRVPLQLGLARTFASWPQAGDPASAASWFGEPRPRPRAACEDTFFYEMAPHVDFAVMERRRSGRIDRRVLARGGRRSSDHPVPPDPALMALTTDALKGQNVV